MVGILRLSDVDDTLERYHPCVIAVYSLLTNSWRCFEDVALINSSMEIVPSTGANIYLNGVYYWMTKNVKNESSILAFDMGI